MSVARWPDQWVCTHLEGFRGTAGGEGRNSGATGCVSNIPKAVLKNHVLTVSVPNNLGLVFLHSGINDDGAAQAQCLALSAKGHFKLVQDGRFKGNAMFRAETICGDETYD